MEGGERKTSLISQMETLKNSHSHCSAQAHKVVALKKAYVDVILNTVKEAAARVMASERRAFQFSHELASAKEEALHMLLRLKHMIDAKTAEAEMASLNQHRKIEELEAQLNEAEDVITDLRAELKHVYLKLEKTRTREVQSIDGLSVKQVASIQENAKPETLVSSLNKELECVTSCDVKSKEPELCKNGFTQRIRALEGNLLDQDVHNQHFGKKDRLSVEDSDEKVAKFNAPSARTEKREIKKHVKCHEKPKKFFSFCRSCFLSSCEIHIIKNCKSIKGVCSLPSIKPCAISKWKRKKIKHRHVGKESFVFESCKPSSVCDDGKFCEDEYVEKMEQVLPLTNIEPMHGSTGVTESFQAVNDLKLVEKAIEKDNEFLNSECCAAKKLTDPGSNMKVEVVDISSTNNDLEDAEAFEENDESPGQAEDSRLLKYTFQRKRKKESLGNLNEKIDSEKSTAKRRVEGKQDDALQSQKA